jgi:hypothetical protein
MRKLVVFLIGITLIFGAFTLHAENQKEPEKKPVASGVCPPFYLKDEAGNIIDPVHNINTDKPYSPKQTCGTKGCHDYNKITEGFHFTQGKGKRFQYCLRKDTTGSVHRATMAERGALLHLYTGSSHLKRMITPG